MKYSLIDRVFKYNLEFENKEKIILRDYLAMERTRMANERTLLSYLRTSLYLILGGIAFLQLQDFTDLRFIGYLSIGLSLFFLVRGVFRYKLLNKKLKKMYSNIEEK